MTREQAVDYLTKLYDERDTEHAHAEADRILCLFLDELGYHDVVYAYRRVDKWYA